tara:strand:+ start:801 stop:1532 length:732 start_codon:yes stop_codon:yes gene_type:complete
MKVNNLVIDWTECIWQAELPSNAKLLACYLRKFMNSDRDFCWPGQKRIARETGLTKPTVIKYTKVLQDSGFLSVQGSTNGIDTNVYHITLPTDIEIEGVKEFNRSVKDVNQGSKGALPGGVKELNPNKQLNKQPNKQNNIYKKISLDSLPVEISVDTAKEYIDHRNNLKKPLTQNAFARNMNQAVTWQFELSTTAELIITEVIDAGWQWAKLEWLKKRLGDNKPGTFERLSDSSWTAGLEILN